MKVAIISRPHTDWITAGSNMSSKVLWALNSGEASLKAEVVVVPLLSHAQLFVTPWIVHHQLPELAQTHVHWIGDAIQPSHPLLPPSPPAFSLSQHQGLFQWMGSEHQVAKVLELQLQPQSFQWIFGVDFLRSDWFDLLTVWGTLEGLL